MTFPVDTTVYSLAGVDSSPRRNLENRPDPRAVTRCDLRPRQAWRLRVLLNGKSRIGQEPDRVLWQQKQQRRANWYQEGL